MAKSGAADSAMAKSGAEADSIAAISTRWNSSAAAAMGTGFRIRESVTLRLLIAGADWIVADAAHGISNESAASGAAVANSLDG